jgi:transposase InsO family protein
VRYQFIELHQGQFSVSVLCRIMQIARCGYYAWQKRLRKSSARQTENETLLVHIHQFFERSKQTYGSPRILRDLKADGFCCGRHRVARIMRQAGLKAVVARRFRVTTDSGHKLPVAENLLDQDFGAPQANVKWASDITYIWTREGWLYLAVVLDLFSRRIVGWSMQPTLERSIVLDALQAALNQRQTRTTLLHHSDRGSQYASGEYQQLLCEQGITCSMSRRGNCWDNAPVESFFGTLKQELVHRCSFTTRQHARQEIFDYIEVWYNRKRRHSALGYLSPEEFEKRASQTTSLLA